MASSRQDRPGSNTLLYVAGASLVAIGLGVAIYFMSKEDDPVIKEVRGLGRVKMIKLGNGKEVIDFEFFN